MITAIPKFQFHNSAISQFQKVTIDMIGNENIEKKQLGKSGLHLNGFGLKKFVQNLIAGIREL